MRRHVCSRAVTRAPGRGQGAYEEGVRGGGEGVTGARLLPQRGVGERGHRGEDEHAHGVEGGGEREREGGGGEVAAEEREPAEDLRLRVVRHLPLVSVPENRLFFDIWEKWGRHIWGKGVLGIRKEKHLISDMWEKWGRHIWGKGVMGIQSRRKEPRGSRRRRRAPAASAAGRWPPRGCPSR